MKLKTILIGLGRIGWKLEFDQKRYHPCTHAGTLKNLSEHFELLGVCDKNISKINDFLKWWGRELDFDIDYRALISKLNSIDFAVIATGVDSHLEILSFLEKTNIPLVLVEKPISYSTREIDFLKFSKKKIYVNFERRYHLSYQKVKQFIEKKTFGELLFINGKIVTKSNHIDPLLEDGVHLIDIILWYVGYPEILQSYWELNENSIEKRSYHILKKNQIMIFIESGGKRDYFEFKLILDFQKGRIVIGNDAFLIFRKSFSKRYEGFFELKQIHHSVAWSNPWIFLYESIYKKEKENFLDAYDGLRLYEELKQNYISI